MMSHSEERTMNMWKKNKITISCGIIDVCCYLGLYIWSGVVHFLFAWDFTGDKWDVGLIADLVALETDNQISTIALT